MQCQLPNTSSTRTASACAGQHGAARPGPLVRERRPQAPGSSGSSRLRDSQGRQDWPSVRGTGKAAFCRHRAQAAQPARALRTRGGTAEGSVWRPPRPLTCRGLQGAQDLAGRGGTSTGGGRRLVLFQTRSRNHGHGPAPAPRSLPLSFPGNVWSAGGGEPPQRHSRKPTLSDPFQRKFAGPVPDLC